MKLKNEFYILKPEARLYQMAKPIIGLTGGIATGKSSVSRLLKEMGLLIIDADQLVKDAYKKPSVINSVLSLCPQAQSATGLDFSILRSQVFNNPDLKKKVEQIIYAELPALFTSKAKLQKQDFIIYDVPLLFERNLDVLVDQKVCIYCDEKTQRTRLSQRDKISHELIEKMISSQLPIDEKRRRCDYVIENSGQFEHLESEVKKMVEHYFLA